MNLKLTTIANLLPIMKTTQMNQISRYVPGMKFRYSKANKASKY